MNWTLHGSQKFSANFHFLLKKLSPDVIPSLFSFKANNSLDVIMSIFFKYSLDSNCKLTSDLRDSFPTSAMTCWLDCLG